MNSRSDIASKAGDFAQFGINTAFLWRVCLTAACGGFLFGYDWVVIGGAKPFYEAYFGVVEPSVSGWVLSSALIGCILGAAIAGRVADRYGRKKPLLIAASLFVVSALVTALANTLSLFVLFRIVGGIGIGIASMMSPVFIAEICPQDRRGTMVAVNQLTIVLGVLAAQIVNLLIAEPVLNAESAVQLYESWNGQVGWRYMFAAELVPAVLFFALMMYAPESPRWLVKHGSERQALAVLERVGNASYAARVLEEIRQTMSIEDKHVRSSELLDRKYRFVLLVGIVLAVFQQWCGINVIFNYAQEVFASAGFDINNTLRSIVATGIVNLLFTILALPLVERLGRRRLMLIGSIGLATTYSLIALAYYFGVVGIPVLALVLCAIAIYATTLAPVTWVLLAEIFPNRIRGTAMAIGAVCLWIASFVLTVTFPILNAVAGAAGTFVLYGIICLAASIFLFRNVPETKGHSLEQLERLLVRD